MSSGNPHDISDDALPMMCYQCYPASGSFWTGLKRENGAQFIMSLHVEDENTTLGTV